MRRRIEAVRTSVKLEKEMRVIFLCACFVSTAQLTAQRVPPSEDSRIHAIVESVSQTRLEADVTKLVSFGTRNTLSDTLSETRGIGAARRWIKGEFDRISADCGGCLEVFFVDEIYPASRRLPDAVNVVNVVAIQRGRTDPNRMVIMSGDIDSRGSSGVNAIDSAPGANDNASGMAGTIEAARLLTQHQFNGTIIYLGLSGEEQGLMGGQTVARYAREHSWNVQAVLNNDMIGNVEGINGIIDNTHARVLSDGTPPTETEEQRSARRYTGGEVDGISRQLARYVDKMADIYLPTLDVMLIYRLDRFGRGGHHRPFADVGFPAVRIMETNENYNRQHQDIRFEDGIAYGDVIEGVDFNYAAKITALNAATLASLAWAPGPPNEVRLSGANRPAAVLRWEPPEDTDNLAGYRVHWRLTDSPTWGNSRWVGDVNEFTFDGLIIDNYFFGVSAVSAEGHESVVVFPTAGR
jgi:Zn-dependent M28 family amino/carboxypeptidase